MRLKLSYIYLSSGIYIVQDSQYLQLRTEYFEDVELIDSAGQLLGPFLQGPQPLFLLQWHRL